jgi:hypothetical protein
VDTALHGLVRTDAPLFVTVVLLIASEAAAAVLIMRPTRVTIRQEMSANVAETNNLRISDCALIVRTNCGMPLRSATTSHETSNFAECV